MIILSTSVRILLRDPLDQSHYLALLHQDPIHCIEHISKQGISVTLFYITTMRDRATTQDHVSITTRDRASICLRCPPGLFCVG
jgi:hypothetical protein